MALCCYGRHARPLAATLFPYTTLFRSSCVNFVARAENPALGENKRVQAVRPDIFPAFDFKPRKIQNPVVARKRHERNVRSEEHTSALQSLTTLVCRLLPETKERPRLRT